MRHTRKNSSREREYRESPCVCIYIASTPSPRKPRRHHMSASSGLHHVTAIAGDPQTNIDFYITGLGLRLVKKTVNFDDPGTYHLYYGDEAGRPASLMPFSPGRAVPRGRTGAGQSPSPAFSVP